MPRRSRRALLRSAGTALGAGLAGCVFDTDDRDGGGPRRVTPTADAARWQVDFDAPSPRIALHDGTVYVTTGRATAYQEDDVTGPLAAISADDGTVEWTESLPQPAFGRPEIHDGGLYLVTGRRTKYTGTDQYVRRFGPDGSEQWAVGPVDHFLEPVAFGSGRAFVGAYDDAPNPSGHPLFAVSLADGTTAWELDAGDVQRGSYLTGQLFAVIAMQQLGAFDPTDGAVRWTRAVDPFYDERGRWAAAEGTLYAEPTPEAEENTVVAVDLADGSVRWRFDPDDVLPTGVATDGERLFVSAADDGLIALDPGDGTERWRFDAADDSLQSPLLDGDQVLYGDYSGTVFALDADDGERRWEATVGGPVNSYQRWGDAIEVEAGQSHTEEFAAFDAGDGTERWRYESDSDLLWAVPGDEHVFVVDRERQAVLALGP